MISPDIIRMIFVGVALLLVIGMVRNTFYGVLGYFIIMVVRPALYFPALGRIEFVIALVVMAVMFFSSGKLQKLAPSKSVLSKNALIVFGVMAVSMVQAIDFTYSKDWMVEFAKIIVFFMMVVTLSENEKDIKVLLWVFGILMTYIAYQAIYNYHTGVIVESAGGDRVDYATADQGMGSGHVALANLTLQGIPFVWYLTLQCRNKILKVFGFVLFSICLYGIVISGSRGGFIGLIAFYICIFYLSKNKLAVGLVGVAGVILFPMLAGEGYFTYMDTILKLFTGGADLSGSSRIDGLRHGFEMLLRRPLLGVGPGCYPIARRAWFGWGMWAHNHYGELMGDLGIIGTVVWFRFLIGYMRKSLDFVKLGESRSSLKAMGLAIFVASIVRLVVGMGSHSLYAFFWYLLGASVIVLDRCYSTDVDQQNKAMSDEEQAPAQPAQEN